MDSAATAGGSGGEGAATSAPSLRGPGHFREDRRLRPEGEGEAAPGVSLVFLASAPPHWLCAVCHDAVQHEPVLTPCRHSFCKSCLRKVLAPPGQAPTRGRCPICRAVVASMDAVQPNESLRAELAQHSLSCTNAGCIAASVCARDWRQHQEQCAFTEVSCKHNAHGCTWRGVRNELQTHLEGCPYHALRSFLNKTNQQIHHLRHLSTHFETALGHAGQQLAALRQWRNGNLSHYAAFLWSIFAEPHTYDLNMARWRSSLDVLFLQTLLLAGPLLAVHHALVCGALSAAPLCRVFGQELSPLLGSEALEAQCMRKSVTPAADMAHALAALLFCVAVLTDGWASPRGWRLRWTSTVVMLYAALLAPVVLADARLLAAVVAVYVLQCALEAITGHHRFLHALHQGAVLAACWTSRHGSLKVVLVSLVWLCATRGEARLAVARAALGRPLRVWTDLTELVQLVVHSITRADLAKATAGAAVAVACFAWGEPAALAQWLGNLLLTLWGGSFGLRFTAASLLQLSLDTRGKNAIAANGCRLMWATAALAALYLVRRCVLLS